MTNDYINILIGGPNMATQTYETKVLKSNLSFASQIWEEYTVYVVKWNYDLGGETVTMPAHCILEFAGGMLINGTVNCTNTILAGYLNPDVTDGAAFAGTYKDCTLNTLENGVATALTEIGGNSVEGSVKGRITVIENEIGTDTTSQSLSGRITTLETAVGAGGSVDTRIAQAKSEIIGDAATAYNTLGKLEDKIQEEAAARDTAVTAEASRASAAEELLRQAYEALTQTEVIVGALPNSGTTGKIYRVPGTASYSDYMWNGSSFVKMAQYDNAIDDKPAEGSENLVKSGGISTELADAYASIYSPEDLYSYTPQTGIIDSNNRWDTTHNSHLIIPLSGISKIVYTTTSSEYGVVIAFLKTYNITETNPDFSSAYPARIYVEADSNVKYDVPVDATYLYLANSTSYVSDVRTIEELRLVKKQDAVEDRVQVKIDAAVGEVSEEVDEVVSNFDKMMNNVTEDLDITSLPDFGYIITSSNKYSRTTGSTLAEGRVIAIPPLASYVSVEANSSYATYVAFLKDTVASSGATPHFADNYESRTMIKKGKVSKFKLNSSCKYLYFAKTASNGNNMQPANVSVEYTMSGSADMQKKELNILFIGSSGEMDMVAYVPPVLKEVLYDYDITIGDMYKSGAQASDYVTYYKENTPCKYFNLWTPDSVSWSQSENDTTLEDALEMKHWNLIVMKGSVTGCRQLMRIIQSLVTYPVTFATVSNIPRVYDNPWESVTDSAKSRCRNAGFVGWIPVATGMENARSNDILKMTGMASCPEPTEFTIPAGKYFSFYHKIRTGSGIPVAILKATRISGTGTVEIYASDSATASDHLVFTLNDNLDHTADADYGANYIKIVNNGSNQCVVRFEDSQYTKVVGYDEQARKEIRIGDYMLYSDNQHTQSGIPTLISAYVIALKILDWTGNANRGISGSSFLPTQANIVRLGVTNSNGEAGGLGHGYSCGVDNYIGSDGNTYDRSQLTLFDGTLYVTTTVFNNTPDANSVSAEIDNNNPINYNNVYAAQEVAMLSVNYPDELTDCSNIVIDVPSKNE